RPESFWTLGPLLDLPGEGCAGLGPRGWLTATGLRGGHRDRLLQPRRTVSGVVLGFIDRRLRNRELEVAIQDTEGERRLHGRPSPVHRRLPFPGRRPLPVAGRLLEGRRRRRGRALRSPRRRRPGPRPGHG